MKTNTKQLATILLGLVVVILFFRGGERVSSVAPDNVSPGQGTLYLLEVRGLSTLKGVETKTAFLRDLAKMKNGSAKALANATFSATLVGGTYYACSVDFPELAGDKEFYIVNTVTWQYEYASASSTSYADFNYNKPSPSSTYRVWGTSTYGSEYTNELTL